MKPHVQRQLTAICEAGHSDLVPRFMDNGARGRGGMWGKVAVGLVGFLALSTGVHAGPALLVDAADGRILYAEDQDDQWYPASLTKIMTAYVVFEALRGGPLTLETTITCSQLASSQPATHVGMAPGAKMTVKNAL